MTTCRCATVYIGMEAVGLNWHPDCPVHPWTDELQAQADKAVEWQRKASKARQQARKDLP